MLQMDTIEVFLRLSHGSPSIDDDPSNPLSRALNQLLVEGGPFNSLSLCFYTPTNRPQMPSAKWLGVLVHSAGNRIIFFPGFSFSSDWLRTYRGLVFQSHIAFQLDHLSLDNGFRRWHFTSPDSAHHLAAGHTEELGEGRYLWFGMSTASLAIMREMRTETIVRAPAPSSDVERRLRSFGEAHDQGSYHGISLDPGAELQFEEGFLHFSFIASPVDASIYRGERHAIPFGSPFLDGALPNPIRGLLVRAHQVRLTPTITIQITAMWLPGSLTVPTTFTTPG